MEDGVGCSVKRRYMGCKRGAFFFFNRGIIHYLRIIIASTMPFPQPIGTQPQQRTTYSDSFIHHITINNYSGMIQKSFNVYEETLKIPMTFSNPKLFPAPLESEQLVSLVDILPTLATLLGAPKSAYPKRKKKWSGVDFSSVVLNPFKAKKVQDYTIFTYDDYQTGQRYLVDGGFIGPWPQEPAHLGTYVHHAQGVCFVCSPPFLISGHYYFLLR